MLNAVRVLNTLALYELLAVPAIIHSLITGGLGELSTGHGTTVGA